MKKFTLGKPETFVPSRFCKSFNYKESAIKYDITEIAYCRTSRGCRIEMPLESDEEVFGLGLQLKSFNHKGRKVVCRVNSDPVSPTGDSHAPVPFFVTNKGYGIYVDTARDVHFYCGYRKVGSSFNTLANDSSVPADSTQELYKTRKQSSQTVMAIDIPCEGVDLYIIEGKNITDIVAQYNMLSGSGCEVPEWSLGVLYRCYLKYTQKQVLDMADYFRKNDIPCSVIGLEPGWQSNTYSCSYIWNSELFPDPEEMIKHLHNNGFHINLWEHAFTNPKAPFYDEMKKHCGDYEVWGGLVPDFADKIAQKLFAEYHREKFVDIGVDGFKLDECDNSDYVSDWSFPHCALFPSGLDGEQYHNLFGVLYAQTMLSALEGVPTLSQIRSLGALSASYPFVLYSDLYDHKDFIRGVVNSGFSGIMWSPELRDAVSKKDLIRRLQTTVFSVQCLINAWYCEETPWKGFDCENEVRELLKVREKLVPMLFEAFNKYKATGIPPVRALVMDYSDDAETYSVDNEYLFCDELLVAPMTADEEEREIYLPVGSEWCDWWSGEKVQNGKFIYKNDNIPVFKKSNVIGIMEEK